MNDTLSRTPASAEQDHSLGARFRLARQSLNLSLEEAANKINLRTAILELIENNQFINSAIPATFMKGYVRNYAKFLKLPEELWADSASLFGETPKNDLGKNARATKNVNTYASQHRWVSYLTWVIVSVVIGMTVLWWWENYQQSNAERDNLVENYVSTVSPAAESNGQPAVIIPAEGATVLTEQVAIQPPLMPATSTEALTSEMNKIGGNNSLPFSAGNIALNENNGSQSAEQENAEQESAVQNTENSVLAETSELLIEVTGTDCWISVRNANRKELAGKLYKQGDVLTFHDGTQYSLIVGAPGNVRITYQGADFPLKVDGRVAKFKLPQQ